MRQSGRSRKTSPIQSPIPAFPKGKEHHTSPILTFPKGKERHTTASNTAKWNSRPLGRDGEGPPVGLPPLGESMGRGLHKQQQL